ncbi:MAG: hypothetical protein MJ240_14015 [Kiritimatiellae bacterium]|nr:hypothetical protein [Kiritimatiellia bacterium]
MKKLIMGLLLLAAFAVSATAVESTNAYGLLKIVSGYTNTIISVPWTGYTEDGAPTLDLRADRLVKPRNLADGDELLLLGPDNTVFASWVLARTNETVDGVATPAGHWEPRLTAHRRTDGSSFVYLGAETNVVVRGFGLWLIRQHPVVNGVTNAVYLQGQWTRGGATATIAGVDPKRVNGYVEAVYTMLANPDCTHETAINDLPWQDVDARDTLILNTDATTTKYCQWRTDRKLGVTGWCAARQEKVTATVSRTVYDYDLKVPAGVGFWYVRRAGTDTSLVWPTPSEE